MKMYLFLARNCKLNMKDFKIVQQRNPWKMILKRVPLTPFIVFGLSD
jgi:hypothetical protein